MMPTRRDIVQTVASAPFFNNVNGGQVQDIDYAGQELLGISAIHFTDGTTQTTAATDDGGTDTTSDGDSAYDVIRVLSVDGLTTIDPASSGTPIQDAIHHINANGARGVIWLPVGVIQNDGALEDLRHISIIGQGRSATTIEITDTAANGIHSTTNADLSGNVFAGFTLSGADRSARGAGSAFYLANSNQGMVTVHDVAFREWVDPVIHFDSAHLFQSWWGDIHASSYDGRLLQMESGGPAWSIQSISAYPETESDIIEDRNSGQALSIGTLNVGGGANRALLDRGTRNSFIGIDYINFEPSFGTPNDVVNLGSPAANEFGRIDLTRVTVDNVVEINSGTGNKDIGSIHNRGAEIRQNKIEAVNDSLNAPVIYHGPADDVDNTSGSPLAHPVVTLHDLTKKVSTGSGYDGGEVDSQL